MLVSPSCGGEALITGFVTEPSVIARILAHLARREEAETGRESGRAAHQRLRADDEQGKAKREP